MALMFTEDSFKEALKTNKVVVIDFFATWCGPCKMLTPVIDKVASKLEGKVLIGKADVDQNNNLAAEYSIMSVPTVIVFVDGKMKDSFSGYRNEAEVTKFIEQYI